MWGGHLSRLSSRVEWTWHAELHVQVRLADLVDVVSAPGEVRRDVDRQQFVENACTPAWIRVRDAVVVGLAPLNQAVAEIADNA